jgi:hypothetical protein
MHVLVYHPETCEPFEVTPSKANELVLEKGWTKTPWKRTEPEAAPEPAVTEVGRGRGRRRRAEEAAPVDDEADADVEAEEAEDDAADADLDPWRS